MSPLRKILTLSAGDFLAKTLYFLAFIHLARVLGVEHYGLLEFALSLLTYLLLVADGGLDLWAVREVAQGKRVPELVSQIVPLRLIFATIGFGLTLVLLWVVPSQPQLAELLLILGSTLFIQALNLKWIFMGQEQMNQVAWGLIISQIVFAALALLLVRGSDDLLWAPILKLVADLVLMFYFARLFLQTHGLTGISVRFNSMGNALKPALTLGSAHGLAQVSYNFDSVMLGFMLGPTFVGWYSAAYKPITALLAVPVSYFLGLFPVLSGVYGRDQEEFRRLVVRSVQLMVLFALPVGVGGALLAQPVIDMLFGADYSASVRPLQILAISATLVITRGTLRQALNAANRPDLDLRCATIATASNVGLNLLLIPILQLQGAALATLFSELTWLALIVYVFYRQVMPINLLRIVPIPAISALVMAAVLLATPSLSWIIRGAMAGAAYLAALALLGDTEMRALMQGRLLRPSA